MPDGFILAETDELVTDMQENDFVKCINENGGRAYIVGGWVRDYLRGEKPHDKDYVVSGLNAEEFENLFSGVQRVGKSFPVYLLEIDGLKSEVALARLERKNGSGYTGFTVKTDKYVKIEDDLYRRDTTINAIAMELPEGKIIDPYDGVRDIKIKTIRAVSGHFLEDPVRALRAARQAAVFGFDITDDTIALMKQTEKELREEPAERIVGELEKALTADKPSVFFRELERSKLLQGIFPEIAALIGKTQPVEFHPEGDAFEHSMDILDKVSLSSKALNIRFAALVHDLGKGTTPKEMEPHHYGHEKRGLVELDKWNRRMNLPKRWRQTGEFVISEHMRAPRLLKSGKIVDFINSLSRLAEDASGILSIIAADHGGLPWYLTGYEECRRLFLTISGKDAPAELSGREVGCWVRNEQIKLLKAKYAQKN